MKRLVLVFTLAVAAIATSGRADDKITVDELLLMGRVDTSRWFVCRLTNDSLVTLDTKTIKKTTTDQFVVWLRWDFSETLKQEGKPYDHFLERQELDCSDRSLRTKLMTRIYYLSNDMVDTETAKDPKWADIPPDSVSETATLAACEFAKSTGNSRKRK